MTVLSMRSPLLLLLALLALPAPLAAEEKPAATPSSMMQVGRVRLYRDASTIEVDGRVAVQRKAIELFACCEGGKVHESVIIVECKPSNLNLALLLLGFDDGGQVMGTVPVREGDKIVEKKMLVENGPRYFGDPRKPVGDRLIIRVRWTDTETSKVQIVRAESMIYNVSRQSTMRPVGWTFTGSMWLQNPRTGKKEFAADHAKTIMTTYHDPSTLFENPLTTGGNDETYHADSRTVPLKGTKVTLVITRPTAKEMKTALLNEQDDEKESSAQNGKKEKKKSETGDKPSVE